MMSQRSGASMIDSSPQVLAIIPARGGSKGIPRKNLRDLCGKPLVAYSIETAMKSGRIDRVVVSTEDPEIAEAAKAFGAEVPVMRPSELAQDRSNVSDAVQHTLLELGKSGYKPQVVMVLYPTHPFRTPGLLDFLAEKVLAGHSPVTTVKAVRHTPWSLLCRNDRGDLLPLAIPGSTDDTSAGVTYLRPHGLCISFSPQIDNSPYLNVIRNPISQMDIDTLEDFHLAEEIILRRLFDFDSYDSPHDTYSNLSSPC